MASLGLKLFYLRTREKKLSQREVAAQLGVRQATISHLEQGVTAPHWALIVDLCRFYDVTPTFLADESRGVVPRVTERWGLRNDLVTLGMWIESGGDAGGDSQLLRLDPGTAFYDEEAMSIRREFEDAASSKQSLEQHAAAQQAKDQGLEEALRTELTQHPRRRGRS